MQHSTDRQSPSRRSSLARVAAHGVQAVPWLDLERFVGRWHGAAWLPLPFQGRCIGGLTLHYAPRDDGLIALSSACHGEDGRLNEAHGVVRQPEPLREPAKLQLRFAPAWLDRLRLVWNEHWVIGLDRDYRWAMVGEPRRRHLWILGREARMNRHLLEDLTSAARRMGYDLTRLITAHGD